MTLHPEIEKMIEEIGETHFHDPSDFKARGAREMAEYLTAPVCPRCGNEPKKGQKCLPPVDHKHVRRFCVGNKAVTRAEFYRITEGR